MLSQQKRFLTWTLWAIDQYSELYVSTRSVADPGRPAPAPYFSSKMRPKGETRPSPLFLRVWNPNHPPPPPQWFLASFNGRLIYLHYLVERLQKFLNMAFSLLQNWMAYTNIKIKNFTLTDSLVFTKNQLQPSRQANYAFCQVLQRKLLCGNYKWITKINLFLF